MTFHDFFYDLYSTEIKSDFWTRQLIFQLWILMPFIHRKQTKIQDFPGLENEIVKFHYFPGFPWPVRTLRNKHSSHE